jgi:DNA repair protein RadC
MKYHKFKAGEKAGTYVAETPVTEEDILTMARQLSRQRLAKGRCIGRPADTFTYLQTLMHAYEHEVFGVLLLDNRHRIITFEEIFRGTLDAASVYPREVVKIVLARNAGAAIFVHNHPSGDPEPSEADKRITLQLRDALNQVGVRTLDHVVVSTEGSVSFAERALL